MSRGRLAKEFLTFKGYWSLRMVAEVIQFVLKLRISKRLKFLYEYKD